MKIRIKALYVKKIPFAQEICSNFEVLLIPVLQISKITHFIFGGFSCKLLLVLTSMLYFDRIYIPEYIFLNN